MLSQLSQLQGRVNRRYAVIFVFASLSLLLWLSFHPSVPDFKHAPVQSAIDYVPSSYDWSKNEVFYPVKDMKSLPSGTPHSFPPVQATTKSQEDSHSRAHKAAVKKAFVKSWEAYKTHAWGQDELMPLSGKGKQSLSGWAVQIVDALDTLWIMGLKDEFNTAVEEVAKIDWARTTDQFLNLFEVTIRYLGGLLAAYDLSGDVIILKKTIELGDMLYATFDTPNRLPSHWLYFDKAKSGKQEADDAMSGAAGGSLCMEFTRLSQITGDPKYYDATERIKQFFLKGQNSTRIPGLWPVMMNYRDETMETPQFSIGAGADSQYEYLPKMHALLGGLDPEYEQMTVDALEATRDNLLFRPMTRKDENILLAGETAVHRNDKTRHLSTEMQHLTCFAGGMYALAGKLLEREDFLDLGSRLTAGCVYIYDSFPTNIMPENSELVACEKLDGPCAFDETKFTNTAGGNMPDGFTRVRDGRYLLRPEAIESVFYMWRITGDQVWRDAAWRMWQGIVKEAETEMAFATVGDVRVHGSNQEDSMESFWLGETCKYFYLIFENDDVINLDDWVLNTEAHPVKRLGRK